MLPGKQTPAVIYSEWQSEIEANLEAGQTPLLDLGSSNLTLADLPLLAALRAFVARRADVTAPVMLAGGHSALWLAVLMQAHTTNAQRRPLDPTVVYAGADRVSYLATLTTLTPVRPLEPRQARGIAPANMLPLFIPYAQARAILPWESLPFAMAEEAQMINLSSDNQPPARDNAALADPWVGWTAIGLAIFILLLAFIR